ncbi:MAG TPA: glycosyltransferase [Lachnospiraceae bacterium]|jgi:MGT family glycosyltransferase|nr:glycosyltransferase [Lachnospiraceae bacterium]
MHIAFVLMGAFGHVNPTLPIAAEMVKRGIRISYFTTEPFRKKVEATGAAFYPVTSRMASAKADPGADMMAGLPAVFLDEADGMIEEILEVLKKDRPDAVVHDFASMAGTLAAASLKVPDIEIFQSYPSSPVLSNAAPFLTVPDTHPARVKAAALAKKFTEKYHAKYLSVKEIFDGFGDFNVVTMQKRFVPGAETFDSNVVFTGVQIGERDSNIDWKFPENGLPLIYFSLGTVFNSWPDIFPILFDAVRDMEVNVIAAVPESIDKKYLQDIPANVTCASYMPQLKILEKADLFITHGGAGGMGEAVYFGVPMIDIPQMPEQAMTAARVEKMGLGVDFPDKSKVTSASLKEAIVKVLRDEKIRKTMEEFSADMKALGGTKASADAIQNYVEKTMTES